MNSNKFFSEHELLQAPQIGSRLSNVLPPPLVLQMICPAWFGVKGIRVGVRILGKIIPVLTENAHWKIVTCLQTGQI
jgi:hypothetical protein